MVIGKLLKQPILSRTIWNENEINCIKGVEIVEEVKLIQQLLGGC